MQMLGAKCRGVVEANSVCGGVNCTLHACPPCAVQVTNINENI